jgi:hypothetical protein
VENNPKLARLTIEQSRRYLAKEDGTPFFWLGDTAWELFHKLSREEAELYLRNRASLGFTVIQAVALAEFDGLTTDNPYGRRPLRLNAAGIPDPTQPDTGGGYDYWQHVDFIVDAAASLGLYVALLPTWGDKINRLWGKGPVVFNETNAREYGQWLGTRYKDADNLVWVLGGDRPLHTARHMLTIRAMAEGLRAGDGDGHLMTFHPTGSLSSSLHVHEEAWLDFNMIQSGHGASDRANYELVAKDYALEPVKPTLDGEPCYEDLPIGFKPDNGYFDAADVRKAAYWALFSGACGHTYGHHSIWSMTTEPTDYFIMDWKTALHRPGAAQMRHVRALMESRPFFERVPAPELLAANYEGANTQAATRGRRYAMFYSPNGLPIRAVLGLLEGASVSVSWYDPRVGQWLDAGLHDNSGEAAFIPPSSGRNEDWVLVLDAVD